MKQFGEVALFGAIGGLLGCIFGFYTKSGSLSYGWLEFPIWIVLGSGASIIFVFVIANADREDQKRLLAVALLSGFFWQPVWEGSRSLVDNRLKDYRQVEAKQAVEEAVSLTKAIPNASGEKRLELADKLEVETLRAMNLL